MSVFGIIFALILLGLLLFVIVKNIIAIVKNIKERREYKKKNQVMVGDTPIDESDYKKE